MQTGAGSCDINCTCRAALSDDFDAIDVPPPSRTVESVG